MCVLLRTLAHLVVGGGGWGVGCDLLGSAPLFSAQLIDPLGLEQRKHASSISSVLRPAPFLSVLVSATTLARLLRGMVCFCGLLRS